MQHNVQTAFGTILKKMRFWSGGASLRYLLQKKRIIKLPKCVKTYSALRKLLSNPAITVTSIFNFQLHSSVFFAAKI